MISFGDGTGDGTGDGIGDGTGDGTGAGAIYSGMMWTGLGGVPMAEPLEYGARNLQTLLPESGQQGFEDKWWSAELRSQVIMGDFGRLDWQKKTNIKPPNNSPAEIQAEIHGLIDHFARRPARLAEIVAQSNSFVDYWFHLLFAESGKRSATATLVQVGIAVGNLVVLYWKNQYKRLRPAQVFPALMPVIITPPHPSYPSGHSTQSHLIALCIKDALPAAVLNAIGKPIDDLAARISENREIAGVHFQSDTNAGALLARQTFELLQTVPSYQSVAAQARTEWQGLIGGLTVDVPIPYSLADVVAEKVTTAMSRKTGGKA